MLDELALLYEGCALRPDDVRSSYIKADHSRECVPDMHATQGEPDHDPVLVGHGPVMFDLAISETRLEPSARIVEDVDPHSADVVAKLRQAEVLDPLVTLSHPSAYMRLQFLREMQAWLSAATT